MKEAAKLFVDLNEIHRAMKLFSDFIDSNDNISLVNFSHIHIFAELALLGGEYQLASDLIPYYSLKLIRHLNPQNFESDSEQLKKSMPPELIAKTIVCFIFNKQNNSSLFQVH